LNDDDADEVAQDALAAFAEACRAGKYEPVSGGLSGWLFALVRDRVRTRWRRRAVRGPERGESALVDVADDVHLSRVWEAEWRAAILREALRRLRDESGLGARTLAAFQGLALDGRDAAAVGAELGLTPNAVYQAKFRAAERLRDLTAALERADHIEPLGT
jgi:RNA polymerase sigma-70 factor (ECF subfamily)